MGGHGSSVTASTWKPGTGPLRHGVPGPGGRSPSFSPASLSSPSCPLLAGPHTWLWAVRFLPRERVSGLSFPRLEEVHGGSVPHSLGRAEAPASLDFSETHGTWEK